jgi:hypothetical protein
MWRWNDVLLICIDANSLGSAISCNTLLRWIFEITNREVERPPISFWRLTMAKTLLVKRAERDFGEGLSDVKVAVQAVKDVCDRMRPSYRRELMSGIIADILTHYIQQDGKLLLDDTAEMMALLKGRLWTLTKHMGG